MRIIQLHTNDGRKVAALDTDNSTVYKQVKGGTHMLRKPPAWTYDEAILKQVEAYIKKELRDNFLYYVQNKQSGGFGYSSPDWWLNVAKTGSGIIGLALTGVPYNSQRTTMALNFIDKNCHKLSH